MSLRVPQGSRTIEFALVVIIFGILTTFTIEHRQTVYEDGFYPTCPNNLKQISIALHGYHDTYGCFPPAYVADAQGTPMHSWRVLILPYLGESELSALYHFDEPWNGPHNSTLADQMPTVFGCPDQQTWEWRAGTRRWKSLMTNYVALVGPQAAFHQLQARRTSDFGGNAGNKLMVVEIAVSDINWMEPRDYDVGITTFSVAEVVHQKSSLSHGQKGIHAMNVNGSIRFVPAGTGSAGITNLINIDRN